MECRPLTGAIVGGAFVIAVLQSPSFVVAQTEQAPRPEISRFDRVAAMTSAHENERKRSSAFFVAHKDKLLLVTTKLSALETNLSTELALPSTGAPRIFRLADAIVKQGADPWVAHRSADVAFCELKRSKVVASLRSQIESMALSLDNFEPTIPTRSSRIEVVGFPMGLGITQERISPLVTTCFVASEELRFEGSWGSESVFFASPAVGAGSSGGIVVVHDEDANECKIVGISVGFNADSSGAKLARIVPAAVLMDFVESNLD